MQNSSKFIAVCIIASLIGLPTLSFAKARGGGGGYSSGSRGGNSSMGFGSRGSRTHQENGAKPIEQSTTSRPSTTPPPQTTNSPTAQPTPATSPSWFQRNPLLAGIAGGLAGTWLGHMLFGATESTAKTTDAESGSGSGTGSTSTTPSGNSFGLILLLMAIGAGAFYFFRKSKQTPAPVFTGLSRSTATRGSLLEVSANSTTNEQDTKVYSVSTEDKAAFQQLLTEIQSAWSTQDVAALRRCVTPEMLSYFSTALAEDSSRGVQNHVKDVVLLKGDVREAWSEDSTDYATVDLRWNARDYTVSTTIPRGEPGYLVEGSEDTATESIEVWTFMRVRNGQWLLSAIQQQ